MTGSHPHSRGLGLTSPTSRARMVSELRKNGVSDERVLAAMAEIVGTLTAPVTVKLAEVVVEVVAAVLLLKAATVVLAEV